MISDFRFQISESPKGNVLLLALLVMTGIVLAGGTIAALMMGEFRRGKQSEWSLLSFYAAESGIEESLWRARKTTDDPQTWTEQASVGEAAWKRTVTDRATELSHPVIAKDETRFFDLYNPDSPTQGAGGSVLSFSWSGAGTIQAQLLEWRQGEFVEGTPPSTVVGGANTQNIDPNTAYRLSVTAHGADARDVRVILSTVGGEHVDLPTPLTVSSEGSFLDSRQTLKMTLSALSYFDAPPPKEGGDEPYIPPELLCGLEPTDPRPTISDDVVLLTVGGAGLGCHYTTLPDALAAVPQDLVADHRSYVIEVRDSGTYAPIPGRLNRKTYDNATREKRTLTIRGADGKQPTIAVTASYSGAIRLYYAQFITIENFRFTGDFRHRTSGIYLEGSSDNILRNNVFTNFDQSSIVTIGGGNNNLIENNQFVANRYTAGVTIYWYNGGNIIRNNIFSNNSVGVALGRMARANTVVDNTFFVDGASQFAIRINGDIALSRAQLTTIDRNHYFVDADRNASFGLVQAGAGRATEERYHTQAEWCTATGFDCASDTNVDLTNPVFVRWREVKKTVCASGCDFMVIQDAFNAMPSHVPQGWRELINENISYTVEVQDSRTYTAPKQRIANISAITDPDRRILFTVKPGEHPTLKASNGLPAVRIYYTSYVTVQGFHIDGPRSSNIWHGGLMNEGGVHNSFIDNVIENVDGPGITFFSSGNAKGNVIRNAEWGVLLWNAKQAQSIVEHNILDRVRYGIFLRDRTNHVRIEHNTGYGNDRQIDIEACYQGTCDVVIQNNIFYSSGAYSAVYWFASQGYLSTSTIDYNTVYASGGKIGSVADVGYLHTPDEWKATGKDEHGVFDDPIFANITTAPFDFHLQSAVGRLLDGTWVTDAAHSPSIDAGDPSSDLVNEPDPNGGRLNHGAYGNTAEASKSAP